MFALDRSVPGGEVAEASRDAKREGAGRIDAYENRSPMRRNHAEAS
jgi:hypothetical protein